MKKQTAETKHIRALTAAGYLLMVLLVGGIIYTWLGEWRDLERLEAQNRQIDDFRKEINEIHIQLIEFSLLGETILDWEDKNLEHYHTQRMAMDSMLCRFKTFYPTGRIDSVRHLLEDKEQQMRGIVKLLDEQQALNEKMARQVPVIVQKRISRYIRQKGKAGTNHNHHDAPFPQPEHDSRTTGAKPPPVSTCRQSCGTERGT